MINDTFAAYLKARRKTLDLTREELAGQVGCSTTTIRNLENGSRRPSKHMAQRLASCLQIPAAETAAFLNFARRGRGGFDGEAEPALPENEIQPPSAAAPLPLGTPTLPLPAQRLFGRDEELAHLAQLLGPDGARLVTITGPAGVGKTHLAQELAWRLRANFADGVYMVHLAGVNEPDLVGETIVQALLATDRGPADGWRGAAEGTPALPLDELRAALSDKRVLLVLDNAEQVLGAAIDLLDLLTSCPGLRILVTSIATLNVRGEYQFALAPLAVWAPGAAAESAVGPAVELFASQMQSRNIAFALTPANTPTIAAICERLDGLPLAIELVAARCTVMPLATMLKRLIEPPSGTLLDVLANGPVDLPPRHRNLRNAIDWCYQLLDPATRRLFQWLAIFEGRWNLTLAEAIVGGAVLPAPDILDHIQQLVEHSLLQVEHYASGETTFAMLQVIREYGREHLRDSGEEPAAYARMADHFVALARRAHASQDSEPRASDWSSLMQHYDNVRAALRWSLRSGQREAGLRLGQAMHPFWTYHWPVSEGIWWLEQLVEAQAADEHAALVAECALALGELYHRQGDYRRALQSLEQAQAIATTADPAMLFRIFQALAAVYLDMDEYQQVRHIFETISAMPADDPDLKIQAFRGLGFTAFRWGKLLDAQSYYARAEALARARGNQRDLLAILISMGYTAYWQRDYPTAWRILDEARPLAQAFGERIQQTNLDSLQSRLLYDSGRYAEARQAFEISSAFFGEHGRKRIQSLDTHYLSRCLFALGEHQAALATLETSLRINQSLDSAQGQAEDLFLLSVFMEAQGEMAAARLQYQRAQDHVRRLDSPWATMMLLKCKAGIALIDNRYAEACAYFRAILLLPHTVEDRRDVLYGLLGVARCLLALDGRQRSTERLLAAAEQERRRIGLVYDADLALMQAAISRHAIGLAPTQPATGSAIAAPGPRGTLWALAAPRVPGAPELQAAIALALKAASQAAVSPWWGDRASRPQGQQRKGRANRATFRIGRRF